MGSHIKVPSNIRLLGSEGAGGLDWRQRRKFRDDRGAHPILLEEEDLDHLGVLHDKTVDPEKD